jgi:Flp pilus assembly pilin Flp
MNRLRPFLADERGGTAIEYALIAVLLGTGLIGGLTTVGQSLLAFFTDFAEDFPK